MSISSIHAHKFYNEIIENRLVWTIRDERGFPAPKDSTGQRSQPFWSSKSRAEKIITNVKSYKN